MEVFDGIDTAALTEAFEAGAIGGAEFRHEDHVRVARELAARYGPEDGLRRMIDGIRDMARRAGRPESYHATITRAWFELIASVDELADAPELFDKRLLERFYSSGRLAAGRQRWLTPDLGPLVLSPATRSARMCIARGPEKSSE